MGLGLNISAEVSGPGGTLERIVTALDSVLVDPLDRLLLEIEEEDGVLYLQLHPAEEPVRLVLDGALLQASAKTSSAGPGYHAWLVDLLDEVGNRSGLSWNWADVGNGVGDETGFRETYDYTRLQSAMAQWLRALGRTLLEQAGPVGPMALSLPVGESVVSDAFAVSPMGYWSRDWFSDLVEADEAALHRAAATFFPAWHPREDARYWERCGRALGWYGVRWVPPENENEVRLYKATLGCFARAHEIDPGLDLPEAEIRELWDLLSGTAPARPPGPDGMGFRRGLMNRRLGGDWWAQIPGYFAQMHRNDGGTVVYYYGDRSIHATSMRAAENGAAARGEKTVRDKAAETEDDPEAFTFQKGHILGWGTTQHDGSLHGVMQAILGSGEQICTLTVVYEDTDNGRDWAEATIRSVYCPPPDTSAA